MKKKKKYSGFLILIICVAILSGIVTFIMVSKKNQPATQIISTNNNDTQKAVEEVQVNLESNNYINNIFDGVQNIYIHNVNLPSNLVEISGKDKSFIIANFKGITKMKSTLYEIQRNVFNLDDYNYQIKIVSKNIKLNFYKDPSYILIDNNGEIAVYSIDKEDMKNFLSIVEKTFIDSNISRLLDPSPSKIYLNARDEKNVYILNNKEIEELISKINILSIENNDEYIGKPAMYPDYSIKFSQDDKEYNFSLINENILIIETPMIYLYCKYDENLWNYINEKLPITHSYNDDDFGYLFNSEKIIVNDINSIYNLQDDTYYNIVIPRWINKSEYKRINEKDFSQEDLRFSLKFFIQEEWKEILIYDNYMVYGENTYFSKNIAEAIRSILMVP